MLSVSISDIAIISVNYVDSRCLIHNINKSESEAIHLLENQEFENRGIYIKYCQTFGLA